MIFVVLLFFRQISRLNLKVCSRSLHLFWQCWPTGVSDNIIFIVISENPIKLRYFRFGERYLLSWEYCLTKGGSLWVHESDDSHSERKWEFCQRIWIKCRCDLNYEGSYGQIKIQNAIKIKTMTDGHHFSITTMELFDKMRSSTNSLSYHITHIVVLNLFCIKFTTRSIDYNRRIRFAGLVFRQFVCECVMCLAPLGTDLL